VLPSNSQCQKCQQQAETRENAEKKTNQNTTKKQTDPKQNRKLTQIKIAPTILPTAPKMNTSPFLKIKHLNYVYAH